MKFGILTFGHVSLRGAGFSGSLCGASSSLLVGGWNFGRRPRLGKRFLWVDSPHQFSKEEEFYFNFLPPHTPTPLKSEENKEINPFFVFAHLPSHTRTKKNTKKFVHFCPHPVLCKLHVRLTSEISEKYFPRFVLNTAGP